MRNPWLDIPEADYAGHMSSPGVGQRPVLDELLRVVLAQVRPRSVLVIGCGTGSGFEHVDAAITARMTAVDVNPRYLDRLIERYSDSPVALETRCEDLNHATFESGAFDLIHAPLLLEYVEWRVLLPRLAIALRPNGVLSAVLQRPSDSAPPVTPTPFTSLQALESVFRFVDPAALTAAAREAGLTRSDRHTIPLPAGKAFDVLQFVRRT